MKKTIQIVFFFFCSFAQAYELKFPEPKTQEEALFLRRIAEFWEEKEYALVQSQITDFLEQYADTDLKDSLYILKGDLCLREEDYSTAAIYYEKVDSKTLPLETLLNKLEAFRKLEWYQSLSEECEKILREQTLDEFSQNQIEFFLADSLYHLTLRSPKDSEEFKRYSKKAKDHLEKVKDPSLQVLTQKPLAFLYQISEQWDKAEGLYLILAEHFPEEKEEHLFKAAELQVKQDKEKALKTFTRIAHLGKKRAKEAAYNRLLLLFEMERYPEITLAKQQLQETLPKEKQAYLYLLLGKSHFILGDYKRCMQELETFFSQEGNPCSWLKEGYLTFLDAAKELDNLCLYEEYAEKFMQTFSKDLHIPKTLWIRSLLYKNHQKLPLAKADLQKLLNDFPDFEKKPEAILELAKVDFDLREFSSARALFKEYLEISQEKENLSSALHYLVRSSIENVQKKEHESSSLALLTSDLQFVISKEDFLLQEDLEKYLFLLAKAEFEAKNYASSLEVTLSLLEKEPSSELRAQAHLLLAYNNLHLGEDISLFCEHAEKALCLHPDMPESQSTHLALFNAYLEKNEEEKAASHLYACYVLGEEIQTQNHLWLADFYFRNTQKSLLTEAKDLKSAKKAVSLYETLLQKFPSYFLEPNNSLEREVIKLAQMYDFLNEPSKSLWYLQALDDYRRAHPQNLWTLQKEVLFEIAKTHEQLKEPEKALALYDQILQESSLQDYLGAYSAYHAASLRLQNGTAAEINLALQTLKDLSLQKNFNHEPLHLEATFLYIDTQSKNKKEEKDQISTRLLLLEKALENFLSEEDILSKDYQLARSQQPDKEPLFAAYIKSMELEVLYCEACKALGDQKFEEALECHKEALALLREIYPCTPFLEKRLEKNVRDWENLPLVKRN